MCRISLISVVTALSNLLLCHSLHITCFSPTVSWCALFFHSFLARPARVL